MSTRRDSVVFSMSKMTRMPARNAPRFVAPSFRVIENTSGASCSQRCTMNDDTSKTDDIDARLTNNNSKARPCNMVYGHGRSQNT